LCNPSKKHDEGIVVKQVVIHNCLTQHSSYANMNSKFDWALMQSFLAALDAGSLLGAAKALQTSQPTVGRHIAELELQLETVLFERTGRGLRATPAAHAIAQSARAMESGAMEVERAIALGREEALGSVRITASQTVACELLPPILAAMRLALPTIQVELVSSNEVSNLLRREADIAVRMVRPNQASLIMKKVGQIEIGAFAHTSYLTRRGTPRTLEEMLTHDLIGGDKDDSILRGMRRLGYDASNELFALRSDDLNFQWQAVRAGAGIGFVSCYVAQRDPLVQRLFPALQIPPLPVWLTVHREIRGNPRIRAAYDFLAQEIREVLA
jgi:DNA-binding transcriptional LysR family regulator